MAIDRAATIDALVLLKKQAAAEVEKKYRNDFLNNLQAVNRSPSSKNHDLVLDIYFVYYLKIRGYKGASAGKYP